MDVDVVPALAMQVAMQVAPCKQAGACQCLQAVEEAMRLSKRHKCRILHHLAALSSPHGHCRCCQLTARQQT